MRILSGDLLHEHLGPETVFSVADLLQVQWRAFSLPQEHLAWAAQTQLPSPEVLQQVEAGWTILAVVLLGGFEKVVLEVEDSLRTER